MTSLKVILIFVVCVTLSVALDAHGVGLRSGRGGGAPTSAPIVPITGVSIAGTPCVASPPCPSPGNFFYYSGAGTGYYMDGDTVGNTWTPDGKLYTLINDSHGPVPAQSVSSGGGYNIGFGSFNQIVQPDYSHPTIWTLINPMTAWGGFSGYTGPSGPLGGTASHKTGGLISVAGNLYTINWRLDQADGSVGYDGQLIMSTNLGADWNPKPPVTPTTGQPYPTVMWPGYDYPIGWVQYGQNYTCASGPCPDNANQYVYAIVRYTGPSSTGGKPRLARILISNISKQPSVIGDWSYYTGGDGMLNSNWSTNLSNAVITMPGIASTDSGASIQYLPKYGQYVAFLYRAGSGMRIGARGVVPIIPGARISGPAYWDVFVARHPWGNQPEGAAGWTLVGSSADIEPYYPGFQFISPQSLVNGGQSLTVMSSGSFETSACYPSSNSNFYCPFFTPVSFTP